jgi:hypothetical protein
MVGKDCDGLESKGGARNVRPTSLTTYSRMKVTESGGTTAFSAV